MKKLITGLVICVLFVGAQSLAYAADGSWDFSGATDNAGDETPVYPSLPSNFVCGDVDGNGMVHLMDLPYLIQYMFHQGSPPPLEHAADMNLDGIVNVVDLNYLNDYLLQGGPAPLCPSYRQAPCADVNKDNKINYADADAILNDGTIPDEDCDMNGDGARNISDVVFLSQFISGSGPAPICDPEIRVYYSCADINNDAAVNQQDAVHLANFMFRSGAALAEGTGDVNADGAINIEDLTYLSEYLSSKGPAPECIEEETSGGYAHFELSAPQEPSDPVLPPPPPPEDPATDTRVKTLLR